ncbi:DUF1554 domain-containing protein [Leptospira yasudae]|uniref:DUF1554 domain-containing protein n=1 Tax=Leptospira yasudae TaxID=2202201 RepID=UPI00108297EF|nr:DUF1554 domain-containing protein [Leptospira yasudae]TGK26225.1 DUF1554 domain-containing protein [Leptospira yasudae]TGM08529.1 DUF1554 domain-containing protein [Leptospira yasudae]
MKSIAKSHLTYLSIILVILSFLMVQCKPPENANNDTILAAIALVVAQTAANPSSSSGGSGNLRVFVTASSYNGNLGGINGADAKCASDANKPSTGTYKAFITGDSGANGRRYACINDGAVCPSNPTTGSKNWILQASKDYYRADQTTKVFTTDANGLITSITNPVQAAADAFWSGFVANSTTDWSIANACITGGMAWTDTSGVNNGNTGLASSAAFAQLKADSIPNCSGNKKLLCVEQ